MIWVRTDIDLEPYDKFEIILWENYYILEQNDKGWLVTSRRGNLLKERFIPYPPTDITVDDFTILLEMYRL